MLPTKESKTNQDAYTIISNFCCSQPSWFFGVFDGHGVNGHNVSNYIKAILPQNIEQEHRNRLIQHSPTLTNPSFETSSTGSSNNGSNSNTKCKGICSSNKKDVIDLIMESFRKTTAALATEKSIDATFSGTTAVTVVLSGDSLYCANLGDSRAVLSSIRTNSPSGGKQSNYWVATPISRDHKPDDDYETKRIIKCGGRIDSFRDCDDQPVGPSRVWLQDENIPGLAMSRSFGDKVAASVGVISEPGNKMTKKLYTRGWTKTISS